jgi:hypothetical protein
MNGADACARACKDQGRPSLTERRRRIPMEEVAFRHVQQAAHVCVLAGQQESVVVGQFIRARQPRARGALSAVRSQMRSTLFWSPDFRAPAGAPNGAIENQTR